jgi:hypothetical protein
VAESQLDERLAHGRRRREHQHVRLLGGEHALGVDVAPGHAELSGQRGPAGGIEVADRDELEPVRTGQDAAGVLSPPGPASHQRDAVSCHGHVV